MCLVTRWKNPRTANEDIKVYKILRKDPEKREDVYLSTHTYFEYRLNKLYSTELKIDKDPMFADNIDSEYWEDEESITTLSQLRRSTAVQCIGSGFHAYLNISRFNTIRFGSDIVFEAIIPKGSQYYKDPTGLIVSNKIKLLKVINL